MDKKEGSVLFLLQDIKGLLFGIGSILLAIGCILLEWALGISDELLYFVGAVLLAYGAFRLWNGWTDHKVVEKAEEETGS